MPDEPLTIWGIPVVEVDDVPADEIRIAVGRGVVRQDGTLEWDGEVWRIKNIGEPYDV